MARRVKVVGVGGSLRAESTSRSALQAALDGAASSGANAELIWVRDLDLPFYTAERAIPAAAHQLAETAYDCDAMIWSSPTYHGSVSGSFKNALDWLILLADRTPPYLSNKPVGLVSTAGGVQGLQAVNSMDFIARALRAWSVPLVLPVPRHGGSHSEPRAKQKNPLFRLCLSLTCPLPLTQNRLCPLNQRRKKKLSVQTMPRPKC